MKKIIITTVLIYANIFFALAQKKEVSFNVNSYQYFPTEAIFNQKTGYYDAMAMANTNFSSQINFGIKDSLNFLSIGFAGETFYKYTNVENIGEALVKEIFYKMPIIFEKRAYFSNKVSLTAGLGGYLSVLRSQSYMFKNSTNLPDNFIAKTGMAGYTKVGLTTHLTYNYFFTKKMGFRFGVNTNLDIPNLTIDLKQNINHFSYVNIGTHFGFSVRF